jgi:hypothetical protein
MVTSVAATQYQKARIMSSPSRCRSHIIISSRPETEEATESTERICWVISQAYETRMPLYAKPEGTQSLPIRSQLPLQDDVIGLYRSSLLINVL